MFNSFLKNFLCLFSPPVFKLMLNFFLVVFIIAADVDNFSFQVHLFFVTFCDYKKHIFTKQFNRKTVPDLISCCVSNSLLKAIQFGLDPSAFINQKFLNPVSRNRFRHR